MPASPLGKIKMIGQVVTILALILGDVYWPELRVIGRAGLWAVVAIALVSGADYFRRYNQMFNRRLTDISVARDRRKAG
jgi:phosphatidylglycerophosphate synthase